MAAVLRVKRKANSSPEEVLIISCKRQKTESDNADEKTTTDQTILHFACTVTDPTEDVAQYVTKLLPNLDTEKVRGSVKRTLPCDSSNVSGKVSRLTGSDSIADRFKVVNCQRSVDVSSKESSEDKRISLLIDIEDSWSVPETGEKDKKEETSSGDTVDNEENKKAKNDMGEYVYDLYCAQTCNDVWFESNQITIQHSDYLISEENSDVEVESTDSNSESHWKNDYPDTETDSDNLASASPEYYSGYSDDGELISDDDHIDSYLTVLRSKLRNHKITSRSKPEGRETDSDSNESLGIL